MMKRISAVAAAATLAACAGSKPAQQQQTQTEERQAISNISYFDVATCAPKKPELPGPVNDAVIIGTLLTARPQVMECLVPPTARGPEESTKVKLKATVSTKGTEIGVSGENLTPEGEKCVREAVAKVTETLKLEAPAAEAAVKGKPAAPATEPAPVVGEVEIGHKRDVSPTVTLGVNDSSNIIGTIRLAQPSMCECYADWQASAPSQLKAKVRLTPAGAPAAAPAAPAAPAAEGAPAAPAADTVAPVEVVVERTGDAKADKVAACVEQKVLALQFPKPKGEITIPGAPFFYIHSGVTEGMDSSPADIRFIQLDAVAGQRTAETAIALGARTHAVGVYDALVKRYQETKSADAKWKMVGELEKKCATLVASDDRWIKAVENQLGLDQKTVALITELKATDPAYAEAEVKATERVAQTQKDLETAKNTKTQDQGVCPKKKY